MTGMGVGDLNWVQEYIGIPYRLAGRGPDGLDCWGLVCAVYMNELNILLPDFVTDEVLRHGNWQVQIDEPADFCLVRTPRASGLPDHWGIYLGGGVLSAAHGGSCFMGLRDYLQKHPESTYVAPRIPEAVMNS